MIELLILIFVWCLFVKRTDKKIKLKDENDRCVP
jgi:hypothetical protein